MKGIHGHGHRVLIIPATGEGDLSKTFRVLTFATVVNFKIGLRNEVLGEINVRSIDPNLLRIIIPIVAAVVI